MRTNRQTRNSLTVNLLAVSLIAWIGALPNPASARVDRRPRVRVQMSDDARQFRREIETSIWIDASIYYGLGLHEKAISTAKSGILLFPKQAGFHRLVGLAHLKLNRCRPAIESFRRYLHLEPKGAFAREIRLESERCLQRSRRERSSRLKLVVSVSGALVHIDGKLAGKSPLETLVLAPGAHPIKIQKPGFVPWEVTVHSLEGQTTFLSAVLRRPAVGALLPAAKPKIKPWRRRMPLDLVLVVDRGVASHTKTSKQAIRVIASKLKRNDRLGIVAYSNRPYLLSRLAFIRDRQAVAAALEKLGADASLEPAMGRARRMLERGQRGRRGHTLLISDGSSSSAGISRVVSKLAADGHTLSTIGLGEGVDGPLMEMIARRGRGRFYAVSDDEAGLSEAIQRELGWLGR